MRLLLSMAASAFILAASAASDAELLKKYRVPPSRIKLPAKYALAVVLESDQRMIVDFGGTTNISYKVATAEKGIGSKINSNQTPAGWHKVCQRFGNNAQFGQVFVARKAVPGKVLKPAEMQNGTGDSVVSRILWLDGLEPGKNKGGKVDSKNRHIYIHGTDCESKLGTPSSHGCIRMGNRDVIDLFTRLSSFTDVYVVIIPKDK